MAAILQNEKNFSDGLEGVYTQDTSMYYSSEEKRIGTWINGKPLYQKSFIKENFKGYGYSGAPQWTNDHSTCLGASIVNEVVDGTNGLIDELVEIKSSYKKDGKVMLGPCIKEYAGSDQRLMKVNISRDNGKFGISGYNNNINLNGGTFYVTVKYTKMDE